MFDRKFLRTVALNALLTGLAAAVPTVAQMLQEKLNEPAAPPANPSQALSEQEIHDASRQCRRPEALLIRKRKTH